MTDTDSLLLRTLRKERTEQVPFWFMRQAGRYLPEYQKIRSQFPHFLEFCYTPQAACEVTLQPIQRFDCDAAILFSDILVIPDALGRSVIFTKGEGPSLIPITSRADIDALKTNCISQHLEPVFETIRQVKSTLPADKALIGFAGSPWTVACYMLEGHGSKEFQQARQFMYQQPEDFLLLLDILVEATVIYLEQQIEAGVDVIQLFDSWAGILPPDAFTLAVIRPTQQIVSRIKSRFPHIPIIGFARGVGVNLIAYANHTGVDALGIDSTMPLDWAKQMLGHKILQGNLDNVLLASSMRDTRSATQSILQSWQDIPFIFNLGHGILPHTPITHVEAMVEQIRAFRRDS